VDGAGRVFVANYTAHRVVSFAAGRVGNLSPSTSLSGANTGISNPQWVAVDGAGRLYVSHANGSVRSFPRLATGDATPTSTLTGAANSQGLAFDSAGNLYVADYGGGAVRVYGADRDGAAAPVRSVTGLSTPHGIAIDAGGRLYVANTGNGSVDVFAAGASGAATPIRRIAGPNTGFGPKGPGAVALDSAGNIYELDYEGAPEIRVFAAGASGNVAPIATIAGPATGLSTPVTVAVGPNADLYVANSGTSPYYPNPGLNAVTIYANPLVARAPAETVAWSTNVGTIDVSFGPPRDNGGPLGATYLARCTSSNGGATRTSAGSDTTLRVANLTPGRTYTCAVRAGNSLGESSFSPTSNPVTVIAQVTDREPPGPPVITSSPEPSTDARPRVTWQATEAGGSFEWRLLDEAGAIVQSARATASAVTLGPLVPGAYVFQVRHIDGAGNSSGYSAPRLVLVLPVPAPTPSGTPGSTTTFPPLPAPAPAWSPSPSPRGGLSARPRLNRARVLKVLLASPRVPRDVKAMIRRGENGEVAAGLAVLRLADWTGDRRPEGIAEISAGGAGRTHAYYVVSDHGGLARVVAGNRYAFNVSLTRRGRGFVERIPRYADADPLCCASRWALRTFRWSGARFLPIGPVRVLRRR